MIVYLDSSTVMRQLIGGKDPWQGWGNWKEAYASVLLRVECNRLACQLRLVGKIDDAQRVRLGTWIEQVCESITLVPLTNAILKRAAEPFPTVVGTLQAMHLATMAELQSGHNINCLIATEDKEMLQAAQSMGFQDALTAENVAVAEPQESKA